MTTEPDLVDRRHGPGCDCARCIGFQPGNELSVRHGAKALLKLAPRAAQIADALRDSVPVRSPADDATIDVLAMVLAQFERACVVMSTRQIAEMESLKSGDQLAPAVRDDLRRLAQDARGWSNTCLRYFDALGLTPTSRARLGADLMRIEPSMVRLLQDDARRQGP